MISDAINDCVARIRSGWSDESASANEIRLKGLVEKLAYRPDGGSLAFAEFSQLLSQQLGGLVLTAHPTFSISEPARRKVHALISGRETGDDWPRSLHPARSPTLDEELAQSEQAVLNIRRAIRTVYRVALEVAADIYPDEYADLTPGFITVASWVGFDLDGRTDIGWSKSLEFRYRIAMSGVAELQGLFAEIDGLALATPGGPGSPFVEHLATIEAGLSTFLQCFELGLRSLTESDRSTAALERLNCLVIENQPRKQSAIRKIDQALDLAISSDPEPGVLRSLLIFRAEWYALGLGLSHIHFRLNAVQLHNAIRSEIALDHAPDRSASRRHYLGEITRLLDEVEAVNIHYGTLAAEQTTAKRLFMLAAQFEKHFDGRTPIRLLVAESDTPFTLLTALYYARLFGVHEHVEISPLFETAAGLQRGDRVIAELLDNPHFLAYIRTQGRFAVQLGFSDSGRYIGQIAANLAIERFKLRLVRLWQERGLSDIQLLFFDTHGESIGRGAHPGSLEHRFLTTHTPRVRSALSQLSVPHKHEVSFQGGDGYRWFASETTALATLVEFLKVRLEGESKEESGEDKFYGESDWSLDFFLTIREFQDHLAHHPGYLAMLDSFAPNLLYPTGSRATKRQGTWSSNGRMSAVNQIRAIPHNAMLQQLGFLVNVIGGIGTAIDRAPDRFEECLENSPRLQLLMKLIEKAEAFSSIETLIGYTDLLNPGWWLDFADSLPAGNDCAASRRLSKLLERSIDTASIDAFVWKVRRDYALLQDYLGRSTPVLEDLHAERIDQIRLIYLKAASVPRFSTRTDVSPDQLVIRLLRLEVPEVIARLREIFPAEATARPNDKFGEVATYKADAGGYAREHEEIFDLIEAAYQRVLEISSMIALRVGSFG